MIAYINNKTIVGSCSPCAIQLAEMKPFVHTHVKCSPCFGHSEMDFVKVLIYVQVCLCGIC